MRRHSDIVGRTLPGPLICCNISLTVTSGRRTDRTPCHYASEEVFHYFRVHGSISPNLVSASVSAALGGPLQFIGHFWPPWHELLLPGSAQ